MDPSAARATVVHRPLPDGKGEVPLSSFMYLFAGIVQYYQNHSDSATQLEASLHRLGLSVGPRALELLVFRDGRARRPPSPSPSPLPLLQWIIQHFWRSLFPRPPGSLERSGADPDEYYIPDPSPLTNIFASPASDDGLGGLGGGSGSGGVGNGTGSANCAAFIAGVLQGALAAAGAPCDVSAVWTGAGSSSSGDAGAGGDGNRGAGEESNETVYVVKFLSGANLQGGPSSPTVSPVPGQRSLGSLPE